MQTTYKQVAKRWLQGRKVNANVKRRELREYLKKLHFYQEPIEDIIFSNYFTRVFNAPLNV